MADRMHPYPMFPQNLTSNSLQQSQIPQQPPQSQQPDPQMISALSNPEHSRMWQQMNQLQNPYRQQPSGDLAAASQMNHQMQEFARGQTLSHGQGQPLVQQIQQSFGLASQRMNPGAIFHDPQANQPQSIMPSNFSNMPMSSQQQQMKAAFNMNPMMHAAMANSGVSRQLKILNQQEMARLQQSGLGTQHPPNQPTSADMFASSSIQHSQDQLHGSPHPAAQPVGPPGANQGMVPGNQQPTVQKRMMTLPEFQGRRNYLFSLITQSENSIATLLQNARNTNDPHLQQKLSQLRTEHAGRKDVYTRFVATFGAMVTQQMANGITPSNVPHINPMAHSTSQQPQQASVSNAQGQPGFITQTNQSVTAPYKFPTGPTGPVPSPIPGPAQGGLNQQHPTQPTPIARPNIPPRTGGTPHQIPAGSLPNNMSPNLGNFAAQGGQTVTPEQTRPTGIMPLDKSRFESTYAQFCRSQNIPAGLRVQIGENRTVDLHQLHVQVMHESGAASVTTRDMWAVIGGRLGFIQFPGNDSEPARSGPGIAQQLHNTYDTYLQHFENAYRLTVQNRPTGGSPQQSINQINPNPLAISNNPSPSMSGNPTELPPNPPRPSPNQQLIAAALRYVLVSAQDMRAQRVPEHMINFVERHRTELMKVYQQQAQIMAAKRHAEQEQQNMANSQGQPPNMHEQSFMGLPPGVSRPPQSMGANAMVSGEAKIANGSFVSENVAVLQKQPPTQDQIQHAVMAINQCKQMFQQRSLPGIAPQHIPEEQRAEYNQLLEQVFKMTSELEPKLPMYFAVFKNDELLRKYVAIVMTVAKQRQLSSTNSPQYIISAMTLRNMHLQVHRLNEEFESRWRVIKMSAVAAAANSQQHASLPSAPTRASPLAVPQVQNISQMGPHTPQNNGRPASSTPRQPTPSQAHLHLPPQSHSQHQPHQSVVPPQIKKNIQPSIPPSPSAPPPLTAVASPTPPPAATTASSSTPATSAPTPQPTHSSPQTPKSPPSKAAGKVKVPARVRKMSSASKGRATPEVAPSVAGVKRPPEEDVATLTSVAPSEAEACNAPSPKKAKVEWEGEPSEALVKKQQELDNIKTDGDAAAFFDRMKELFAMTATDNEIHHELASTLDQILAGVTQEPADAAATAAALSVHGVGDAGPPPTALSPHMGPANDAFSEYIDFSSFTTLDDEDNDSKAPTPDLVPSSETNPSPESGSEGDSSGSTGSPDKAKIDEPGDRSDPLRLGALGEIDGGESAYYQTSEWKWEGPMYTLDQPWAISTA